MTPSSVLRRALALTLALCAAGCGGLMPYKAERTLQADEIRYLPGSNGDVVKAIQNLPGIARPPLGIGQLIVRGTNPEDTAYYVDGTGIDDHGDAHAADGLCNAVRRARVTGHVEDGRFTATQFELLPASP